MSRSDPIRRRVIVSGRVQGVGFRDGCRSCADRLAVVGSVRNVANGTVEVVVEGPPDEVGQLISWCRSGPSYGDVTGIDVTDEPVTGLDTGFRIIS